MADPRKESERKSPGQGADENVGEKREGASENTGQQGGLPERRDMGVRKDLGEGDTDNYSDRMGTPTESAP
jgi:hypothetical protein